MTNFSIFFTGGTEFQSLIQVDPDQVACIQTEYLETSNETPIHILKIFLTSGQCVVAKYQENEDNLSLVTDLCAVVNHTHNTRSR